MYTFAIMIGFFAHICFLYSVLTFLHLSKNEIPKQKSFTFIHQFLYKRQVEENMKSVFRNWYTTVVKIQYKIQLIRQARACKQELILFQFERERKILIKYYQEKRKNKKMKQIHQELMDITPNKRDLILSYYYNYYVAFTNIKAAIHWCAIDGVHKHRRLESDHFTDEEFRNLQFIERNLADVNSFLLKGTKDGPCLGEPPYDDDLYPLEKPDSDDEHAKAKAGAVAMEKNMTEESGGEEDPDGQIVLEHVDDAAGAQGRGRAPKEAKKSGESPNKKDKKVKSKERSVERGGKGKKRKTQKEAAVKIENVIDMDLNPQRNQYIPAREMMQRLVMRASQLKDKDLELQPFMQDIRPWIKKGNKDIEC